ncbi:hypothetical protein ATO49_04210 [Mycolicibacterium fortuitum subsp. fortuitum DSM 46621 = ATCC 6841 = JCM 6387]|nr:hypothetical protein ATO49_04210 [Mycolicibacterium fortuitum subsp. fortuitum DSM 46621 = ATCC 6841 = JCM 6387]
MSVWEIFGALLSGGRLVVVPDALVGSPDELHDLLVAEQVTVLNQTPSAAAALSSESLESAALVVAGEACPAELVDRWALGRLMINGYGRRRRGTRRSVPRWWQGRVWCRSEGRCRVRRSSCWTGGCVRCPPVWSGNCMWPGPAWPPGTSVGVG